MSHCKLRPCKDILSTKPVEAGIFHPDFGSATPAQELRSRVGHESCVQTALEHASLARSVLLVFQALSMLCMILGALSAMFQVPSVAAVASTAVLGAGQLLEQLIPVAIVTAIIAFMPHDGEIAWACLRRSRYPVTSMLRFFLAGALHLVSQ